MPPGLVAWGGPLPILAIFLIIFRQRLHGWQKAAFVVIVYAISILTGALSEVVGKVGSHPSAVIAGIIAPLVYCAMFSAISLSRMPRTKVVVQEPAAVSPAKSQWNPIIIAAIIQAIASIIVALITKLGK